MEQYQSTTQLWTEKGIEQHNSKKKLNETEFELYEQTIKQQGGFLVINNVIMMTHYAAIDHAKLER